TVKPETIESKEALTYDFDDPKPNSAVIAMRWEKVVVHFRVEVNTHRKRFIVCGLGFILAADSSQPQIHTFARGLQGQGREDEALELFPDNIKKDPNSWVAHNEVARIAVAAGDY